MKFDSMDKMKITSSESKEKLKISGKGLISSLYFKAKVRPHKCKKSRYAISNVSEKDLSKIIRELEKLPYEIYKKKSPKHEPTDSYFYLTRQLAKFMMRADFYNSHVYPERTETTATKQILTLHICSTDESKLEEFIVDETLS